MKQEIELKLEQLQEEVSKLEESSDITVKELKNNDLLKDAIERRFQVAIEIVIDISSKINSLEQGKSPETYRETIKLLSEHGVVEEEFAERFQNIASFRNMLVHHYTEIQMEKLQKYLSEDLEDFHRFTKQTAKYIQKLEE